MHDITRRRAIALGGGFVALGGTALAYHASEPAYGLTISGLDVDAATRELGPSEELTGVRLDLTVAHEWSVQPSNPDEVTLEVFVEPADGSPALLDATAWDSPQASQSGETDFSADITDTGAFQIDAMDPAKGGETTTEVGILVVMELRDGGERIGQATVRTTADVRLTRAERTVMARVAGTGALLVETA